MTTRYSRREGAPLQEWAGGNEGCWATARPAAPPPAPSRDALAKSTSSLSLSPSLVSLPSSCEHSPLRHPAGRPRSRGAIRRFTPAILPTDTVLRSYSPSSRFLRFFRSFRTPSHPRTLVRPLSRSFIAFFIFRVIRVRASRPAHSHRVSFVSRR